MTTARMQFYWLRNPRFDRNFLMLPFGLGLFSALLCLSDPALFPIILFADLWLLGYHHVISTYTRIAFDWASAKRHYFLVFVLPFIMLGVTVGLYFVIGKWVITTVYFYWQWFHYTRQSYGISRYYLSRAKTKSIFYHPLHTVALYSLPVTGVLYRSWQNPGTFLFSEFRVIPVPFELVLVAGIASAALIAWQLLQMLKVYLQGELNGSYAAYMLQHYAVFAIGYLLIDDINIGWLSVNIWHNLQYILFVWVQNNLTYKSGVREEQRLISSLSQDGKFWSYIGVCLGVTVLLYLILTTTSEALQVVSAISAMLIVFMTVNFHHYVVDAVIWRRKKSKNTPVSIG